MKSLVWVVSMVGVLAAAPTVASAAENQEPMTPGWLSIVYTEETVIDAAPATIWNVLVDLPRYPEWNPWLLSAVGDMVPGGKVVVDVVLNGGTQKAEHTVITVEPYTRFCWKDAGWTAILVPAQRCRTLTLRADGKVTFVSQLILDGLLAKLADLTNGASLRSGMHAETDALRVRAESL